MGMRRLFIIRKDLHLSSGKLAAMIAHCAEGYWIRLIENNISDVDGKPHVSFDLDKDIYDGYLCGRITKTVCEAKNLNKLLQARDMALALGLVENQDFGMINDACLTDLTPEWIDENGEGRCTVGIWFKPLEDEVAHSISKKYQLYKD
jgi:peptidyl-tRNA hydrolase